MHESEESRATLVEAEVIRKWLSRDPSVPSVTSSSPPRSLLQFPGLRGTRTASDGCWAHGKGFTEEEGSFEKGLDCAGRGRAGSLGRRGGGPGPWRGDHRGGEALGKRGRIWYSLRKRGEAFLRALLILGGWGMDVRQGTQRGRKVTRFEDRLSWQ